MKGAAHLLKKTQKNTLETLWNTQNPSILWLFLIYQFTFTWYLYFYIFTSIKVFYKGLIRPSITKNSSNPYKTVKKLESQLLEG